MQTMITNLRRHAWREYQLLTKLGTDNKYTPRLIQVAKYQSTRLFVHFKLEDMLKCYVCRRCS